MNNEAMKAAFLKFLQCSAIPCGDATSEQIFNGGYQAALSQQPVQQPIADPLDMPLPCDIKIGAGTMSKGIPLRTLVLRMTMLHSCAINKHGEEIINEIEALRVECDTLKQDLADAILLKDSYLQEYRDLESVSEVQLEGLRAENLHLRSERDALKSQHETVSDIKILIRGTRP